MGVGVLPKPALPGVLREEPDQSGQARPAVEQKSAAGSREEERAKFNGKLHPPKFRYEHTISLPSGTNTSINDVPPNPRPNPPTGASGVHGPPGIPTIPDKRTIQTPELEPVEDDDDYWQKSNSNVSSSIIKHGIHSMGTYSNAYDSTEKTKENSAKKSNMKKMKIMSLNIQGLLTKKKKNQRIGSNV